MSKLSEAWKKASHKYCAAVVVAAGSSRRMGEDKLAMKLGKMPVLACTLRALNRCGEIDEIVVVTQAEKLESVSKLCRDYGVTKAKNVVEGGESRTESALNGVLAVSKKTRIICIHDGARPLVTEEVVNAVVRAAAVSHAAAPAVPVKDTIRIVKGGVVTETPDRESLRAIQTPQAFDADLIKGALTAAVAAKQSYTDDCAAAEALGVTVTLVAGSEENIKVTVPADIPAAEAILAARRSVET